jgi:hypothetical protein
MRIGFIDAGITGAPLLACCENLQRPADTPECSAVARAARADQVGVRMAR